MRLTCPNCEAQYEVPDDVVPPEGRDVQCSNCGHTWFVVKDILTVDPELQNLEVEETPPPEAKKPAESQSAPAVPADAPPKPTVSDEAKAILQEEAAREQAFRSAEAEAQLKSAQPAQEDLDLDDIMADVELQEDQGGAPAPVVETGQNFPAIEDVNPSLDASGVETKTADVVQTPAVSPRRRRWGYRFGFLTIVLAAAVLTALYYFAPELTQRFPEFTDQINTYVIWVNDTRQALYRTMQDVVEMLRAAGAPAESTTPTNTSE